MTGARPIKLMVVSGETSGDAHAARVVDGLRRRLPDLELIGMGGEQLEARGMRLLAHVREAAVVGISEVLRMLPRLLGIYRRLVRAMREERPDAVLLVDYPDMNLRLAGQAKRLGIPVYYYIVPQVWAWRASRARTLRERVELSLCLFGFEEKFLRERGVAAEFVGHPLIDALPSQPTAAERLEARAGLGLTGPGPWIALLPGSRGSELRHHLKIFLEAGARVRERQPGARFVLALAPGLALEEAAPEWMTVIQGRTRLVLQAVDLALTKSGTSTVEAALCGTPMVIGYRVSRLTYWIARHLVRVPWIGMANLLAGEAAFPELIQDELTPESLARTALEVLAGPPAPEVFQRIRDNLGEPGSHERAANKIADRLTKQGGALRKEES